MRHRRQRESVCVSEQKYRQRVDSVPPSLRQLVERARHVDCDKVRQHATGPLPTSGRVGSRLGSLLQYGTTVSQQFKFDEFGGTVKYKSQHTCEEEGEEPSNHLSLSLFRSTRCGMMAAGHVSGGGGGGDGGEEGVGLSLLEASSPEGDTVSWFSRHRPARESECASPSRSRAWRRSRRTHLPTQDTARTSGGGHRGPFMHSNVRPECGYESE
jgi:hypothetical protein